MKRYIKAIIKWLNSPKGTPFELEPAKRDIRKRNRNIIEMRRRRKLEGKKLPKLGVEKELKQTFELNPNDPALKGRK